MDIAQYKKPNGLGAAEGSLLPRQRAGSASGLPEAAPVAPRDRLWELSERLHDSAHVRQLQALSAGLNNGPDVPQRQARSGQASDASFSKAPRLSREGGSAGPVQLTGAGGTDRDVIDTVKPSIPPSNGVMQRHIYVGRRPIGGPFNRRNAEAIARRIAPALVDRIMAEFDIWIGDTVSDGRRFDNLQEAIEAIRDRVRARDGAPRQGQRNTGTSASRSVEVSSPGPSPEQQSRGLVSDRSNDNASESRTPVPIEAHPALSQDAHREQMSVPTSSPSTAAHDERLPQTADRQHAEPVGSQGEVGQVPAMREETETHVGFEIEVGASYTFPLAVADALDVLVNHTLVECVVGGRVVLEMLLDDIRRTRSNATAQVEFRTPPLAFSAIDRTLNANLRAAIANFPVDMLVHPRDVRTGQRDITWRPTRLLRDNARNLADAQSSARGFRAPARLAQHATTSIELQAFAALTPEQQRMLFPAARGAQSKQGVLNVLANLTQGGAEGRIDASTRGRNTVDRNNQATTVKTPIEAIMAADPELETPPGVEAARSVTVGGTFDHRLGRVEDVVADIRRRGAYPAIQGENHIGYRAIAEKLQPPLRDRVSGQVRVLVEHRVGGLVDAVNHALAGRPEALARISDAARAMDAARRRPRRQGQTGGALGQASPDRREDRTEIAERSTETQPEGREQLPESGTRAEQQQAGAPVIAPPAGPLNLNQLVIHYMPGILWAEQQGTFSHEFGEFRNNLHGALLMLQQNGLNNGEVATLTVSIPQQMTARGVMPGGPYVEPEVQEQIFDAVSAAHGRYLWALLRYFTHQAG